MATTRNKVMWQEGMLMRPHHFQQQQRYNDYLDNQRFRAMNDLSWGFTELTLNNELSLISASVWLRYSCILPYIVFE